MTHAEAVRERRRRERRTVPFGRSSLENIMPASAVPPALASSDILATDFSAPSAVPAAATGAASTQAAGAIGPVTAAAASASTAAASALAAPTAAASAVTASIAAASAGAATASALAPSTASASAAAAPAEAAPAAAVAVSPASTRGRPPGAPVVSGAAAIGWSCANAVKIGSGSQPDVGWMAPTSAIRRTAVGRSPGFLARQLPTSPCNSPGRSSRRGEPLTSR